MYVTRRCAKTRSRNRRLRCKSESNETIIIPAPYTAHIDAVSPPPPAPPSVSRMSQVRLNPVPPYRSLLVHHLRYHPYGFLQFFFLFCFTNHVQFIVIVDRPSVSRKHPVFFVCLAACTQVLQILRRKFTFRYLYAQRLALRTYARAGKTLSSKHVFTYIVRRKSVLPLSRV